MTQRQDLLIITSDGLRGHCAAMDEGGNRDRRGIGRGANNRIENGHVAFRRRERAMLRFRRMKSLQKTASAHNSFNRECHHVDGHTDKDRRSAALVERQMLAGQVTTVEDRAAS